MQMKSDCFIKNLEMFGKVITRLAAILLYAGLQGLWTPTAGFTQGQICRPEFLESIPGSAFIHSIIPKGLTYSVTRFGCGQVHHKIIKQTTPNELL